MTTKRPPILTDKNHADMDVFLGFILEAYKTGKITKDDAAGDLAHLIAAIDIGNATEHEYWFANAQAVIHRPR